MKVSTQPVGAQGVSAATEHLRRNFWLGVVSGIGYNLYVVFLSTELVMTWFLTELTDSNLLISLLIPIEMGSWYFLQLLLSGYVERKPLTMPLYRITAGIRVVALGLLAVSAFAITDPRVLIVAFLLFFSINALMGGIAALPFMNIVAKTIPAERRGQYFGWRRFAGGLFGIGAGFVVRAILSPESGLSFPDSYGWLIILGTAVTTMQVISFSLVIEPAEAVDTRVVPLKDQFRRAARLPFRNANFGRYLGTRVAIVVAALALPFYAVYARRVLDAPENMVGTYLLGMTLAGVLSNLVFARISDRHGNRLVMRMAALTAMLTPAAALLVAFAPGLGPARADGLWPGLYPAGDTGQRPRYRWHQLSPGADGVHRARPVHRGGPRRVGHGLFHVAPGCSNRGQPGFCGAVPRGPDGRTGVRCAVADAGRAQAAACEERG